MEKPCIIVFSSAYHPLIGGAEIAIEEAAEHLRADFDFLVITHRARTNLARREVHRGVTILRLGFGTALDRMLLFPFLAAYAGLHQMCRKKRVILWGVMVSYASLGALLIKVLRPHVPLVLTLQEGDSEEHLRRGKLGLVGLSWRVMLKYADEVTAISTYLARHAAAMDFSGFVSVIPNGVDIERFRNREARVVDREHPVVITTSRLVPKNGVDILIRAIAEVKKEIPGIRCHIAGDGAERPFLEELARNEGVEREVVFLGAIPYRDIPRHLHHADVFVRASRSEGMGSSFVEAIAAGLPIIGTPVGGITDIITDGKTGMFTAVDDPHDLAKKIMLLVRDTKQAQIVLRQGMAKVEANFSWDTVCGQYQEVFERVLERPLNIVIASPMLPPDLGGVAHYALHFAEEFLRQGHQVRVVSYAQDVGRMPKIPGVRAVYISLRYPTGIRHVLFFFAMMRRVVRSDLVLVLDQFSVGVPAVLACVIARVPYVTRMEGDFLWESYVERTRRDTTLADFWRVTPELSGKERFIRAAIRRVLTGAERIVFSSEWRKNMVVSSLPGIKEKSLIVHNVWPEKHDAESVRKRERVILWAGRMLYLKNLDRLMHAFAALGNTGYELHLVGTGPEEERIKKTAQSLGGGRIRFLPPMSHEDMLEKIASSSCVVLPSLSDVGPALIGDAIATGTPFLMTEESGYTEFFSEIGLFVNPLDERDIAEKLRTLMDEGTQAEYRRRLAAWKGGRDWSIAAQDWMNICERIAR